MAIRKIVKIDEELCDGCGLCIPSCAEGALQIVDGKARLVSEVYCDGLGACLGECPQGAISIEEREAADFDEHAAKFHALKQGRKIESSAAAKKRPDEGPAAELACGCPGSALRTFPTGHRAQVSTRRPEEDLGAGGQSELTHWPVQLRLVPPEAPFLKGADILVSADCVPFTVPDFHQRFLRGRAVLVGCPKLDDLEYYREKLAEIIREANPRSITVLRMEVPCCGGITHAVLEARNRARPELPVEVHTLKIRGGDSVHTIPGLAAASGGGGQ